MNLAFDPKKEQEKPELEKKEEQEKPEFGNQKQQENEAPEVKIVKIISNYDDETKKKIRKNLEACRKAAKISKKYPIDTSECWLKFDIWD
jgi:hypothetical protein